MRLWLGVAVSSMIGWSSACVSEPTPHPERDASTQSPQDTATSTPTDRGPDDDNDGTPDCEEISGTWDGAHCTPPGNFADPDSDSAGGSMDAGDAMEDDVDGADADSAWSDGDDAGTGDDAGEDADTASSPAD